MATGQQLHHELNKCAYKNTRFTVNYSEHLKRKDEYSSQYIINFTPYHIASQFCSRDPPQGKYNVLKFYGIQG